MIHQSFITTLPESQSSFRCQSFIVKGIFPKDGVIEFPTYNKESGVGLRLYFSMLR